MTIKARRAYCPQETTDHVTLCTSITCYDKYVELAYEGPEGPDVMTHEQWDESK